MPPTKEYRTWQRIIARCHDENHHRYPWYGARGISVSGEWRSNYLQFLADMGRAPTPAHTIDRIDNDGGYRKGNCRWATVKEQAQNRRSTVFLTIDGQRLPMAAHAEARGIDRRIVWKRINLFGWSQERAVNTPVAPRKPRKAA